MSNGWCSVAVDHEIALVSPVVEVDAGAPLKLDLVLRNHGATSRPATFRVIGLGGPLFGSDSEPIEPSGEAVPRTVPFELPERLHPGQNPVAIEWFDHVDGTLAVTDAVIDVDDASAARIELVRRRVRGLLDGKTEVLLENTGEKQLTLELGFSRPDSSIDIDFAPQRVRLEPGQLCHSKVRVRRRTRWFGAPRDHVFDITATGSNRSVTATGTFHQWAVFHPLIFKVLAVVLVVVPVVLGLVHLAREFVDDRSSENWTQLENAPDAVAPRVDHTATWISFDTPDDPSPLQEADDRATEIITGVEDGAEAVVIWGGVGEDGRPRADGARYDVATDTWSAIQPLNQQFARRGHTAAWTGEQLVIWGGFTPDQLERPAERGTTAAFYGAAYDPIRDDWMALPPSGLEPRVGHSMIWTGRDLIVFGGITPDGRVLDDGGILRSGRIQGDGTSTAGTFTDLSNGIWSLFRADDLGTFEPLTRAYHAAAWTGEFMVVSGGVDDRGQALGDAYAYDVASNRWDLIQNPYFEPRACHQAVAAGQTVVVLGGLGAEEVARPVASPLDRCTTPARSTARANSVDGNGRPLGGLPRTSWPERTGAEPAGDVAARTDPRAWAVTVNPDPDDPAISQFEWQPLIKAPHLLGTDFSAAWTGTAIGIALPVPELDTVAPIRYELGKGAEVSTLPTPGQLEFRSQLTAAWSDNRVVVWGGRSDEPCEDSRSPIGCPVSTGAMFDVRK